MQNTYRSRTTTEPHKERRDQILKKYPNVRTLTGPNAYSALLIGLIAAAQIGLSVYVAKNFGWLGFLLTSFTFGAVASHALFVLVHEATHNLIFKKTAANRWIAIIANFGQGFPSAMAFRNYHLLHHRHQGLMDLDADLPGPIEAKLIGRNPVSKALWLFSFMLVQGFVRPARLKNVSLWSGWVVTNLACHLAFSALIVVAFGWLPLVYLAVSTWFAVGLHPLGARWVQEHFVFRENQETYSYYGPWNYLMLNVGYHNEHHDLMNVAWNRLPALKAAAPEFYTTLYSHSSYTRLMMQFLFDPKVSAFSRVVQQMPAADITFVKTEPGPANLSYPA